MFNFFKKIEEKIVKNDALGGKDYKKGVDKLGSLMYNKKDASRKGGKYAQVLCRC